MFVVDGKKIAEEILAGIDLERVAGLRLTAILVGENEASRKFLKVKEAVARRLGVEFELLEIEEEVGQKDLEAIVEKISNDRRNDFVILQLPLPMKFKREKVIAKINSQKDIDNLKGEDVFVSPAVAAMLEIFKRFDLDWKQKRIGLVGEGFLVGGPIGRFFKKEGVEFEVATKETKYLKDFLKDREIVITGTGVWDLFSGEDLMPGASVIDFGYPGDLEKRGLEKLNYYTPTPGGTGPILVACLMRNLIEKPTFAKSSGLAK